MVSSELALVVSLPNQSPTYPLLFPFSLKDVTFQVPKSGVALTSSQFSGFSGFSDSASRLETSRDLIVSSL